ncbi:hypothetical protein ACVMYR_31155 [Micromonospora sp. PTRAS2]
MDVQWRGGDNGCADTVWRAVRGFLAKVSAGYRVTAVAELVDRLNAYRSVPWRIHGTELVVTLLHVRLTATAEAQTITEAWEEEQREEAREILRQQQELRQLRYLRDEIFGDPGIARMYWHVKHPTDLTVLAGNSFEDIAERLKGDAPTAAVSPQGQTIAGLMGEFLGGLDEDERSHLIDQLGVVFRSFRRPDLAERLPSGSATPSPRSPS